MEAKKSKKAAIENQRGSWLLMGLVVALAFMFVSFEWTQHDVRVAALSPDDESIFVTELVPITFPEEKLEPPPPPETKVTELFEIVENNMEVTDNVSTVSEDMNAVHDVIWIPPVVETETVVEDVIHVSVEVMPEFPGGTAALMKYLGSNIKYPTISQETGSQGKVIVQLRCRDALLGGFPFFTRLKKKYTRRIFKLGLPVATLNTLFAFVNMFLCRTASEQGGHIGLMTFTTGGQIEAITWNTSQGFSTALSAFIAQNYAAGRVERVLRAWYTTLWMTGIFGTFCTLLFVFFGNEVFAIFVPEQAAYEAGGVFLRIDGYSQLFMMLEITMQGVFYGIGRTIPPAIISISCNYMRIPLAILFVRMGMGVEGIWWAVCITTVAKGLILLSWFIIIKKKCLSVPSTIKG